MKRLIITLLTVLITLASWATDLRPKFVSFVVEGDTVPGYGADKLLDDDGIKTKWFVESFGSAHVIMDAGAKVTLRRYTVWNADDTYSFPDRRWEQFSIYGSDSSKDDNTNHWELIHKVDDAVILANNGGLAYEGVVQNKRSYRYYKLMVTEVYGFDVMQMSDLLFTVDEEIKPKEEIEVHKGERNVVITEKTHELKPGVHYIVNQDVTKRGDNLREPMEFTRAGVAVIEFVDGHTLNLEAGENTSYPAIWLGAQSTLVLKGNGKLIVKGGNGSMGNNGENASSGRAPSTPRYWPGANVTSGIGGNGGNGGRGAAPAIGGFGGLGGKGGSGGGELHVENSGNPKANRGSDGQAGKAGSASGNLIVMGNVSIWAYPGSPSTNHAKGGEVANSEKYVVDSPNPAWTRNRLGSSGGGGGAGANGCMANYALAAGGGGGGGGGAGGASGAAIILWKWSGTAGEINKWHQDGRAWGYGGAPGEPSAGMQYNSKGQSFTLDKSDFSVDDWRKSEMIGISNNYDHVQSLGGKAGEHGPDGKFFVLSSSVQLYGSKLGNKIENIPAAEIENYFKLGDSKCLLDDVLSYITLDDGATFSDGSKQMCFYPSMILPADISVKYSNPEESLRGVVFYDNNGVMHLAFDKEGKPTDDFYSYIAVKRDGEYRVNGNILGKIRCVTLNAETSAVVLHTIKNNDGKVLAEYLDWKIDNLEGSDKASFNISPYSTMEGKSISLVLDGEKYTLNKELCNTDFNSLTVTLDRTNRDYYAVIEYVVNRTTNYTLDASELAAHQAHFTGEYTQSSQLKAFSIIKLPMVTYDDYSEYVLDGWKVQEGAKETIIHKTTREYYLRGTDVKISPVFLRIALSKVFAVPCQYGTIYVSKTPDGEESTNYIVLSRNEPVNIYARVVPNNNRSILQYVSLTSNKTIGRMLGAGYFHPDKRVLIESRSGVAEDNEMITVQASFFPFFFANVQNPSASDDDLGEDYGIALSTDGVNMYYDAPVFDAFMNNGSRVHAGTLDEFEYAKDDYVHLYCHTGMDDDSFSAYNLSCTLQHPEDFEGRDTDNPVDLYEKTVEVVHNADGGVADAMMKWKLYPRFSDDIDIAVNFDDDVHTLKIENYTQSHPDLLWTDVYDRTKELNSLDAPVAYMGLNGKALCDINASGDELIQLSLDNYDGIEAWAEYDEMVDDEGNKVTIVEPMKFVGDSNKIQGMHLYNTIGNAVIRILPAGFMEDILTGIKQVEIDESADKDGANAKMTIYDLSGRRIAVTSKLHGVYIMNNKKVVVR